MKYRSEIDGLRTLAVLPVVIYHLKIPIAGGYLMPGGFLGVDIFFVISGFLITKIILDELQQTGGFSFRRFYLRRARRILPALIMVILASMVAAFWFLTPSEVSRFATSALAALGFVSNIYWYFILGEYGAPSSLFQPLLHTWSLAIEEQFYLVFPLFLVILGPVRRPAMALLIVGLLVLGGLALAEITSLVKKQFSFFSPTSRIWELMTGSAMALYLTYFPSVLQPSPRLVSLLSKLAIAVLVTCMLTIDLAEWNHPGLITVPVVLSTAIIILYARPGEWVTDLLSTAPFVFLGKLSYSIYLWHYPVFAYGRLRLVDQPGPLDMLFWTGCTLSLSIAGYYLVEKPLRFSSSLRVFSTSLAAGVAAIAAFWVLDLRTDLIGKVQSNYLSELYGGDFYDNEALKDQSWTVLHGLAGENEKIGRWNARRPSRNERENLWFDDPEAVRILVIGNSHSKDLFNAIHFAYRDMDGVQVARFALGSNLPAVQLKQLFEAPNFRHADVVVIASRYTSLLLDNIPQLIAEIQSRGKRVALVGNTAEFESPGRDPIFDYFVKRSGGQGNLQEMNSFAFLAQKKDVEEKNRILRRFAAETGVPYLSRHELVCPPKENACTLIGQDGEKMLFDYGHWTIVGAAYFGRRMVETEWLAPILELKNRS